MTTDGSEDCPVLHVDMDAFYASVVLRGRPDLAGVPVVVAGGGDRGVILCATYPARRRGIRSGTPTAQARRRCPELVVVPPDFDAFAAASTAVFEVFDSVTPRVEPLSQEEAFLHVEGARRTATPRVLGELLRQRVVERVGITCSVGIASTRSVAKLASRRAKPDGLVVVRPDEVRSFLDPLDVGELWGVGPSTRARLERMGVTTVADARRLPVELLQARLGRAGGAQVHALLRGAEAGRLHTAFRPRERQRSIGSDRTLARDVDDPEELHALLLGLTLGVTARARRAGLLATSVAVRVRYPDFTTVSRARTLTEPSATTRDVHTVVARLFDGLRDPARAVRLVGVRLAGLRDSTGCTEQLRLGDPERGWRATDEAADRVRQRFGRGALGRATLVDGQSAERGTGPAAGPPAGPPNETPTAPPAEPLSALDLDPVTWWSW
ncbi:MAG TPA: DNA polymerase IV [Nocardioides sp.]